MQASIEAETNLDDLAAVSAEYERKLGRSRKPRSGPWLSGGLC